MKNYGKDYVKILLEDNQRFSEKDQKELSKLVTQALKKVNADREKVPFKTRLKRSLKEIQKVEKKLQLLVAEQGEDFRKKKKKK